MIGEESEGKLEEIELRFVYFINAMFDFFRTVLWSLLYKCERMLCV